MGIFYIVMIIVIILDGIFMAKNSHTGTVRGKIIDAIYLYRSVNRTDNVNTSYMETYERTLFRFWDWGYKNVVPADVYEKIKPFIK